MMVEWPELKLGTCPATGDDEWMIVRDDSPSECYHCGAKGEVK